MEVITELMPECPLKCVATALLKSKCASSTPDPACLCSNQDFNDAATLCIKAACSVRDGLTAKNLTMNLCGVSPVAHPLTHDTLPISATFLALAGLSVLLRLFSRYHMRAAMWWDDACDILGLVLCIAFVAVNQHMIQISGGFDMWFVKFDDITRFLVGTYVSLMLYILGRSAIRFSIILFYMRIFQIRLARQLLRASFVINAIFCAGATFTLIFQCAPINFFWNQWDGEHKGKCVPIKSVVWACAAIAFVFDLWLIVLPVPFITRLKLSWQKKVQTSIMFMVGLAVLVVSVFRFTYLNGFVTSENPTMDSMETGLLSNLELAIGIMCACLPSVQVLFKPFWNRIVGWSHRTLGIPKNLEIREDSGQVRNTTKLGGIRLTTTIRQDVPSRTESETYLPLHDESPSGKEITILRPEKVAQLKSEAWA